MNFLVELQRIFLRHGLSLIVAILAGLIMSIGLLDVPRGLTSDEYAFGLNATTLSRSGLDENGVRFPLFVLSLNGKDWRQPVTQYYQALFFKIFGASVYNLRLSSVFITVASALLMYLLVYLVTKKIFLSLVGQILFLTTPIVWIQSHMGLDNNVPVFFVLIWLIGLMSLTKNKLETRSQYLTLILMAISLGLSFYAYKGMRVAVPAWGLLTGFYLFFVKKSLRETFWFWAWLSPFFLIIPWIEVRYAGAITGGSDPVFRDIYSFMLPYLSYFDPTFLFIKGDATVFHSTGRHGMFLLATLPLVMTGVWSYIKREKLLLLTALAVAPILMGSVGSVHRASRIMCIVPIFILIMIEGIEAMLRFKYGKIVFAICFVLIGLNFFDFRKVYNTEYAKISEENFGNLKYYKAYERLSEVSKTKNLTPYVSGNVCERTGDCGKFFQQIYFNKLIDRVQREEEITTGVVLTEREKISGFETIGCDGERTRFCVLTKVQAHD